MLTPAAFPTSMTKNSRALRLNFSPFFKVIWLEIAVFGYF